MFPAWKHAHGDWIYPAGQSTYKGETVPSVRDPDLTGPLDAFAESHSSTSHTVTVLPGEGHIAGCYVGSDDETVTDSGGDVVHDVTLDPSTNNQVVYLGFDHTKTDVDALIIGKSGAFTASDQPRIPIWEFDTDSNGVTAARSQRPIKERINTWNEEYDSNLSGKVDDAETADDASALDGRSLTTVARDTRTITLPRARIPANDDWRTHIKTPAGTNQYLLGATNLNASNNAPSGQDAVVVAGDGTELYRLDGELATGTPANPVAGPWDRVYLEFVLENATSSEIVASASFELLME